jgi:hypothetical protein
MVEPRNDCVIKSPAISRGDRIYAAVIDDADNSID